MSHPPTQAHAHPPESAPILAPDANQDDDDDNDEVDPHSIVIEGICQGVEIPQSLELRQEGTHTHTLVSGLHHVLNDDEKTISLQPCPTPSLCTQISISQNIPAPAPSPTSTVATTQSLDDEEIADRIMPHAQQQEHKNMEGDTNTTLCTSSSPIKQPTSESPQLTPSTLMSPEHVALMNTMTAMGFPAPDILRAIHALSPPAGHARGPSIHIDALIEWMDNHPDDPTPDGLDSSSITHVMSLTGCTHQQACDALLMHHCDLNTTVEWLLLRAEESKISESHHVKMEIVDSEHQYLHYGDCIVLRSTTTQRYIGVHVATDELESTLITGSPRITPLKKLSSAYDKDKSPYDHSQDKRKMSYGCELTIPMSLSQPTSLSATPNKSLLHNPIYASPPKPLRKSIAASPSQPSLKPTPKPSKPSPSKPETTAETNATEEGPEGHDTRTSDAPELPTDGRVYASCTNILDDCWFIVRHPTNPQDVSVIKGGSKIALETNQGNYVGVEANGSINGHRGPPIGELMEWRILHATNRDSKQPIEIKNTNIIFESCETHVLQTIPDDENACCAKTKSTTNAVWSIILQNNEKAAKQFSWLDQPTCAHPATSQGRWASLRTHFRLVALRILKNEVTSLESQVRQQRKDAQRKLNEDKACTICLDKPPNTAMIPCGHVTACDECGPSLNSCPICRDPITRVVVFKS